MSLQNFYLRHSEGGWFLREILFFTAGMSGCEMLRNCLFHCGWLGWRKVNTGWGKKRTLAPHLAATLRLESSRRLGYVPTLESPQGTFYHPSGFLSDANASTTVLFWFLNGDLIEQLPKIHLQLIPPFPAISDVFCLCRFGVFSQPASTLLLPTLPSVLLGHPDGILCRFLFSLQP